jgi:transcriptional regulator with XRE-family HTH domain
MLLAERLEQFIAATLLKNKVFAERLGMQPTQLQKYLSGTSPSAETLEKFAEAGCNIHWLITGEGRMYADNEAGRKLKKAHQGIGKEHEPELMGNLTDIPEFNQRVIDIADLETIESLITKIKGQTNATPQGT